MSADKEQLIYIIKELSSLEVFEVGGKPRIPLRLRL